MNEPIVITRENEHLIPQIIAKAHMRQIEQSLLSMPVEVLREAKRRQDIERHNAAVDAKKAAKSKSK